MTQKLRRKVLKRTVARTQADARKYSTGFAHIFSEIPLKTVADQTS